MDKTFIQKLESIFEEYDIKLNTALTNKITILAGELINEDLSLDDINDEVAGVIPDNFLEKYEDVIDDFIVEVADLIFSICGEDEEDESTDDMDDD